MSIQKLADSKNLLAKLMAGENLTIRHMQTKTAYFDPQSRILICPIWENMNGALYDLMMGHEVGHALFTPAAGLHDATTDENGKYVGSRYKHYLNVIEDIRIEKLIKRKYPGLRPSFIAAYKELLKRDFFGIERYQGNYSSLILIDRLNIFFKTGSETGVKFLDSEQELLKKAEKLETWDDVKALTELVWKFDKKKLKEKKKSGSSSPISKSYEKHSEKKDDESLDQDIAGSKDDEDEDQNESDNDDNSVVDDSNDEELFKEDESEESDESDNVDDSEENESTSGGEGINKPPAEQEDEDSEESDEEDEDPESITDQAFRDSEGKLVNNNAADILYMEFPDIDLKHAIMTSKEVLQKFDDGINTIFDKDQLTAIGKVLRLQYLKRNKSYIDQLSSEFEMRKNASQYARELTSRSGELDTRKLDRYRFTNDIFKKITTVEKGKNHGMVMVVDFSASMDSYLKAVIEQTLNLVSFCRKARIPFQVYSFTDCRYFGEFDYTTNNYKDNAPENYVDPLSRSRPQDQFTFEDKRFFMAELINSDLSDADYKKAFDNLLIIGELASYDRSDEIRNIVGASHLELHKVGLKLGGTPFLQMLLTSRLLITNFKKRLNIDHVVVVHLTDGEGGSQIVEPESHKIMTHNTSHRQVRVFVDPITRQHKFIDSKGMQANLTEFVAELTGCDHIGYYFDELKGLTKRIERIAVGYAQIEIELKAELASKGYFAYPALGYKNYYYVALNLLNKNRDEKLNFGFEIKTKSSKKKALKMSIKHAGQQKNARSIVSKFAREITNNL